MIRVLGIGGEPCTGKSTLMRAYLAALFPPGVPRTEIRLRTVRALYHPAKRICVLGVYAPGQTFPGTDRLSMAVQPDAVAFAAALGKRLGAGGGALIFEGDRLFNSRFMFSLLGQGAELTLWRLVAPEEILGARHKHRADSQSAQFLKSRKTKLENIDRGPHPLQTRRHVDDRDQAVLLRDMQEFASRHLKKEDKAGAAGSEQPLPVKTGPAGGLAAPVKSTAL